MRQFLLLCLPAIFGMVCGGRLVRSSSGQQHLDYNPLVGPNAKPNGPAVIQNHGAVGNPVAAANIPPGGNSGNKLDYNLLEGPPKNPNGPLVNQQHGYKGAPIVGNIPWGGSSQDNDGDAAAGGALGNPPIIPNQGDSSQDQDGDGQQAIGGRGAAVGRVDDNGGSSDRGAGGGNGGTAGAGGSPVVGGNPVAGGSPLGGNPAAGSNGNSNNAFDAPKAAPAIGSGGMGQEFMENQALTQSSMSGGAIAGVVIGVAGVAAIGTAAAVVILRGGPSIPFSRA